MFLQVDAQNFCSNSCAGNLAALYTGCGYTGSQNPVTSGEQQFCIKKKLFVVGTLDIIGQKSEMS